MCRYVVIALISIALPSTLIGQTTPPAEIGLSASRLDNITEYLQRQCNEGRVAGAVAAVSRYGRIGYLQAVGKHDLATNAPMHTDSLFRIASMTKAITSAAVMSLVEDDAISLDDPLSKHLPEFAHLRLLDGSKLTRQPTIHDLLTHRSGLTYGWFGPEELDAIYGRDRINHLFEPTPETIGDRVEKIADVPLKFQPGTAWDYGVSTDVLGRVVEVASGLTLEQFFRERFFRPLKMLDTYFYVPTEKQQRLAGLYTLDDDQRLVAVGDEPIEVGFFRFSADYCTRPGKFYSGGGGLVSSTNDYLRFLHMLLRGGELDGVRVLKRETVSMMTQNQIGDLSIYFPGHGDGFGFGFGVVTDRGADADELSVGSYSWGGIFNTYFWVDPQEQLVGLLMTQVFPNDHLGIRDGFRKRVYSAIDDSGFEKLYHYQPGDEHANPHFNGRQLRVNAAEVSVHPDFAARSEPRSSGMARILIEEDLRTLRRADLDLEVWGGHPGTANKRVTINGRSTHAFPDVGTAHHNCTHEYPSFNLRPIDLVNGYNSLQFACDTGETFWGHYIVDDATLRIGLQPDDPRLKEAELESFGARVTVLPFADRDGYALKLDVTDRFRDRIADVRFEARCFDYDHDGDGWRNDWRPLASSVAPTSAVAKFGQEGRALAFSTELLPAQQRVQFRAFVTFKDTPDIRYRTPATHAHTIAAREGERVQLFEASDLPSPFWSRDSNAKECVIELDVDPQSITAAQLHVVAWTGGAGNVADYFTLNGKPLPIADGHDHQTVYSRITIDPALLRRGKNEIRLLSDTKHHGIEIMLPGPALMVRHTTSPATEESAGVSIDNDKIHSLDCYRIKTPTATYYLDKIGAGLAALVDRDGKDWLSFNPKRGSGAGGEYRGFPNAVFKEAGSYFHARNAGTAPCSTTIIEDSPNRVVIGAKADNGKWAGKYVFTPTECTFVMTQKPPHHNYWVLYEGTPGGTYNHDDWWMTATDATKHPMTENHMGDLPATKGHEWIAFGDPNSPRMLVLTSDSDDSHPDRFYQMEEKMTVFGFGRAGMTKHLATVPQSFSIALVESTKHSDAIAFVSRNTAAATDNTSGIADQEANANRLAKLALSRTGSPQRGAKLFADKRTKCATCHRVGKVGGQVGPDLSNIGGKFDRTHLIDSLLFPSRQIGYGYETTTVLTVDGQSISGIAKEQTETHITLVDANNKPVRIAKQSIERTRVSKTSIMPSGLEQELSEQEFVDLVSYLETLGRGNGKFGSGVTGPVKLPEGFELTTIATGLSGAVAMDVAPDGRIFVCEQGGALRVIDPVKGLLPDPVVTIPVEMNWERGLIGVTFADDFAENPYVYVVYVASQPHTHHRISRFRVDGNAAVKGSEEILFRGDDQSQFGGNVPAGHQGGGIHFGPDGKLYVGLGEQTAGKPAQQFDALQGKILRINRDGSIPNDNPFQSKTKGKYKSIWATGCRNPFTFAFSRSGDMLINDVGGKFEEINRGVAGANYGWPNVDHGPTNRKGITAPIHSYPQSCINGGDFCGSDRWPESFQGKYFFADFNQGWVKTIDPRSPNPSRDFLSGIRRPVDLRFSPDGGLYVLLRNAWVVDKNFEGGTGAVVRISPTR